MTLCLRVLTTALILFAALSVDARGRQLLEVDGIELRGIERLVLSGGGTCNVLESDTSYEARKDNHGAPMDIWRLDFSVHNGSGRWLDHLIARFQIEAEWPDCTNWDGPDAGQFAQPIEWADSAGHIQESGRNVVAPGQTLTETKFFIVLPGDREPQFENWSMDFDFAAAPPAESGAGSPAFIVAPVPVDAQVTLLNAAEPYRRRMPLEPGRYEVEVSAPGYAPRRVWVDHNGAGVHRVELVPLAGDGGAAATGLPPAIQADLHLRKAEQALREGNTATAREALERVASLQAGHGLELAAEDHYRHAQAWEAAGEPRRAVEAAVRYLQAGGRDAEHYEEALDLINRDGAPAAGTAMAGRVGPGTPSVPSPVAEEPRAGESQVFDGMEFAWVPAGEFLMGSTSEEARADEQPVTRVRISRGFWLGKYEVTQSEWQAVMGANPSQFSGCGSCPVESVSWDDAQAFIGQLNGRAGGSRYRLPTEAEWEYAARAGTVGDRYGNLEAVAWYRGTRDWDRDNPLQPVGQKAPNAWGLHDMLGNTDEWVQDWNGVYPGGSVTDPTGPASGQNRVVRGCSWDAEARSCRTPFRLSWIPFIGWGGFRLLRAE